MEPAIRDVYGAELVRLGNTTIKTRLLNISFLSVLDRSHILSIDAALGVQITKTFCKQFHHLQKVLFD